MDDTLYLSIATPLLTQPLPAGYAGEVLDAIRQALILPRPFVLPVFVGSRGALSASGLAAPEAGLHPGVAVEVDFTVGGSDPVAGRLSTSSLSPAMDAALVAAPTRADSLHLLHGPWLLGSHGGPVRFYVTMLSARPPGPELSEAVAVLRVPHWAAGHEAVPVPHDSTAATEPSLVKGTVREEQVALAVVIDEAGQPVPSTMRLLTAHYREFARAAVDRLRNTGYRAASIEGCAVKSIVEFRYRFPVQG